MGSSPLREPAAGAVLASRRDFLACCASLALASAGCAGLGARMRSAYAFAHDPPPAEYRPVFRGLIRALLPFEDAAFPLSVADVEHQLLDLFRFEEDERYLQLQQTLVFFDDVSLFALPLVLTSAERTARDVTGRGIDEATVLEAARETDRSLGEDFARRVGPARRFTDLAVGDQREYLSLWARSGFIVKRRFRASAKALIMISAYSQDALWPAIGYDGPIVQDDEV